MPFHLDGSFILYKFRFRIQQGHTGGHASRMPAVKAERIGQAAAQHLIPAADTKDHRTVIRFMQHGSFQTVLPHPL